MSGNWVKWATGLLALIASIWVGAGTIATKTEVKEVEAEVVGQIIVVQKKVDRHVVDDEIFYTNRRIWQIKQQESVAEQVNIQDCDEINNAPVQDECNRLELQIDKLSKQRDELYK